MRTLSLAFLLLASLGAQTMSIEEYDPKSTLVVPQHPVKRAKYPFIDVHNHQYGLTPESVDKLVADMDAPFFDVPGNAAYRTDRVGWLRKLFDLSCADNGSHKHIAMM